MSGLRPEEARAYERMMGIDLPRSAETFAVGDVVRLKSGGPAMTVTEVRVGEIDTKRFHVAVFVSEVHDARLLTHAEPDLEPWGA